MWMDKRDTLKKTYFKSFFGLIVLPILLIFSVSLSIISVIAYQMAVDGLQNSHRQIVYALTSDVKDASLQLSHLVYVNGGEFMELAAAADTEDAKARYTAEVKLSRAFQIAILPMQGDISTMIYLKDGRRLYLKDEVTLPAQEVRQTDWYKGALERRNQVTAGGYDAARANLTYTNLRGQGLVLVAALSPDVSVDRSEKIEMVSLFTTTQASGMIQDLNRKKDGGTTFILDAKGDVLLGAPGGAESSAVMGQMGEPEEGVSRRRIEVPEQGGEEYTYIVSREPMTGWRVVTGIRTAELTEGIRNVAVAVMLVIFLVMVLFYLFSNYFLTNIIGPVHRMVEGLRQVEKGNLDMHLDPTGQKEVRDMLHSFNRMTHQLKTSIQESETERQKKHEAEMRALQSQINPHFLVNSLNSIRFMAQVSKYDGIRRMAEAMIKILTCSFRSNSSFYSVREELEVLDSFIYLMKIRYSNGFDVAYQVDENCLDCYIPRLILQPIVENSIVHGFGDTGDDIGHLEVSARREGDALIFEVRDDGSGMMSEQLESISHPREREKDDNYGIGIENVYTRLKLNFGDDFSMRVESEKGKYTRTVIRLPVREGADE